MMNRYSRQILFERFGEVAQRRLREARACLVGCGALGSVLADTLTRAGVGRLTLCDRDYIELDNLQRQVLFDERDIEEGLPKAEAAARKLRRINSEVTVEGIVTDVNSDNVERLTREADLILDGTDNFETRFLINDVAVRTGKPWIYGAVVGASGLCMTILPHETPCLRCVFETAPPPEMNPTCDTAGVLGPAVKLVASFQAMEAMKLLSGLRDQLTRKLIHVDAWTGRVAAVHVQDAYTSGNCPCCQRGVFEYLDGDKAATSVTLCGRDAVQIQPAAREVLDFDALARKMTQAGLADVQRNPFMLRARVPSSNVTLTLFRDGRTIIKGTKDAGQARSIHAKYVGA